VLQETVQVEVVLTVLVDIVLVQELEVEKEHFQQ
jgi:hypothetical protein